MAYDIVYRQTTPINLARPSVPNIQRSFVGKILGLCVAGAAIVAPEYTRRREISRYRREFSTDAPVKISRRDQRPRYFERRLATTMEVPVVPMNEFDFANRG